MGNRNEATTAVRAARKVAIRYSRITRPMLPEPVLARAREAITSRNTSTGATARRAPTNRLPSSVSTPMPGAKIPSAAPMIRPQMMRLTKLISFHFCSNAFTAPSLPLLLRGPSVPARRLSAADSFPAGNFCFKDTCPMIVDRPGKVNAQK